MLWFVVTVVGRGWRGFVDCLVRSCGMRGEIGGRLAYAVPRNFGCCRAEPHVTCKVRSSRRRVVRESTYGMPGLSYLPALSFNYVVFPTIVLFGPLVNRLLDRVIPLHVHSGQSDKVPTCTCTRRARRHSTSSPEHPANTMGGTEFMYKSPTEAGIFPHPNVHAW